MIRNAAVLAVCSIVVASQVSSCSAFESKPMPAEQSCGSGQEEWHRIEPPSDRDSLLAQVVPGYAGKTVNELLGATSKGEREVWFTRYEEHQLIVCRYHPSAEICRHDRRNIDFQKIPDGWMVDDIDGEVCVGQRERALHSEYVEISA